MRFGKDLLAVVGKIPNREGTKSEELATQKTAFIISTKGTPSNITLHVDTVAQKDEFEK